MAKVQKYELMVIFDSQGDEDEIRREFDVVQSLVEKRATEFIGRAVWGLKEFKYPIKKRQSGYYVYYVFKAGPEAPAQISEALKMDEMVLRHLIVRGDENSEKYLGILESGSAAQTETPAREVEEQEAPSPEQAAEEKTQPESTEQPETEAPSEEAPPEKAETTAQPESGEEPQPSGEAEEKTESEESKEQ
ncbi:MAG: 30S ribosomal protein S6 [Candidatus Latescibacterota bacterium]|nr:MAG: 30S ribosomal protein S6 [Candidatus Latescibacterota bacterium]